MKLLEYNVAWVDDQPDKAQGYEKRLGSKLAREGLDLVVDWVSDDATLNTFLSNLGSGSPIDLIMVDWKLGQKMPAAEGSGAIVAKLIRDKHSYASIVFYSATEAEELRKTIAQQRIDGVFCVNRQYFVDDVWYVVAANLRKIFDFNSMRGLYMAAVSEFDHEIRAASLATYSGLPEQYQKQIKESLIELKRAFLKERLAAVDAIDKSKHLGDLLKAVEPGSWELCQSLTGALQLHVVDGQHRTATEKLARYQDEVLTPRNDLAHGKTGVEAGKKVLTRGNRSYDATSFTGLRQTLMDHYENIALIRSKICAEMVRAITAQGNNPPEK